MSSMPWAIRSWSCTDGARGDARRSEIHRGALEGSCAEIARERLRILPVLCLDADASNACSGPCSIGPTESGQPALPLCRRFHGRADVWLLPSRMLIPYSNG